MLFILLLCSAVAGQMIVSLLCRYSLEPNLKLAEGRSSAASCVFLNVWETDLLKKTAGCFRMFFIKASD